MPKNKIEDLRNNLFETMERLMDPDDKSMTIERAQEIGKIGQVIVNSAKVEVDFIKQTGHGGSGFIQGQQPGQTQPPQMKSVGAIKSLGAAVTSEKLCLQCTLPDCNETSPHCLIQIEKRKVA